MKIDNNNEVEKKWKKEEKDVKEKGSEPLFKFKRSNTL